MIIIITVLIVPVLAVLVRSRKLLYAEVHQLKAKSAEPSAIYEEVSYVRSYSPSPTAIGTEQNVAYISVCS